MAQNLLSFGNLRNQNLYTSKQAAIEGLQAAGTNDGVIKLARYTEGSEVKTIFGIYYANGTSGSYTIYESFKETIDALWNEIAAITGGTESIQEQIKAAVDALKGGVDADYDTLKKIEDKVKENFEKGKVTLESEDGEGNINKRYTFKQGGVQFGTIDIYKDSFLKTVQLIDGEGHVIDDEHPGVAKYIQFVFVLADGTENTVNIAMASFIQDLEAGAGLTVDANGQLNIVKDQDSEDFLEIKADSIAIVGVQNAIDTAVQAAVDNLVAQLNAEIDRAKAAEQALDGKINDEVARATNEEALLNEKIANETARAEEEEGKILDEVNKITITGIYGVSAKTDENRVTKLRIAIDDDPIVESSPLSTTSAGLKFATALDCGFYDKVYEMKANSANDLKYLSKGDYSMKMTSNISNAIVGANILGKGNSELNLNGKTLDCDSNGNSVFFIRGSEHITINDTSTKGTAKVINYVDSAPVVWATNNNCIIEINGGNFISSGNSQVIYAEKGVIEINGGTFRTTMVEGEYANKFVLNCFDANYKSGTANIIVKGGKFYNFDPMNNLAEGENTNFVAAGYKSVRLEDETIDGIVYSVYEVVKKDE